jgi:hypothetical protein
MRRESKDIRWLVLILGLGSIWGCQETRLELSFAPDAVLRYRFVSERDIALHWDLPQEGADGTTHVKERLDLVMAYTATSRDPNGTTRMKATCQTATVSRSRINGLADARPDAVEQLAGRSFTFAVDPNGRFHEYASLASLMQEIAAESFRTDAKQGRVKAPDMVWDVLATQLGLWDAVPPQPDKRPGDRWTSCLPVPTPWVSRRARDIDYTFARVEAMSSGPVAVITSTQTLSAERAPRTWPIPYSGRMRQSGTFGFLMGHKIHSLAGTGVDLFHLKTGRIEGFEHHYRVESQAFMPLNLSAPVRIHINQTFTMEPYIEAASRKDL